MINSNLRKTEFDITINNISPETIIKIMTTINKQKYIGNGAELEDLYVQIDSNDYYLKKSIIEAYQALGFNLLQHDPTMSKITLFLTESYS